MSEIPIKRRLRERKRRITTLEAQGYRVRSFDTGPFHLIACKGKTARAIRICFTFTTTDDILSVRNEPVPDMCLREIWQISGDGRTVVVAKIAGN